MFRTSLLAVAVGYFCLLGSSFGIGFAQDKKDPPKTEPPEKDKTILGKSIGEWIIILRTHENPKYRKAALIALEASDSAGKTGLPAVISATDQDKEKDPAVRQDAVMLIGRLGPKTNGALKTLIGVMQTDKADSVREAAATAIGKEFTVQAVDYIGVLIEATKDKHQGTRIAVFGALRNMGRTAEPAFPVLFEAAKNKKEHVLVRDAAVHTLTRHAKENPKTVPMLVELLKDTSTPMTLREAAAEGLGRVGTESDEAVTLLCAALIEKELDMRKAAAVALGTLGAKAKAGWPTVKDRLKYTEAKDKTYTPAELDSSVRNHLIRLSGALGKINDDAIRVLIDAAKFDKSTENRIAAIQELAELGARAKGVIRELETIAEEDARSAIREAADKAVKQIKLP
jgi:HEAT repeat protein